MTFYPVVNGGSDKKSGARGIHIPSYSPQICTNIPHKQYGEVPKHLVAAAHRLPA